LRVQEFIDTSHLCVNDDWNLLWKIKAPSKVKNIIWPICRPCVPTIAQNKGVNCPNLCVLCSMEEEDNLHVLFKCPSSQNVWIMTFFSRLFLLSLIMKMMLAVDFQILRQLSKEDAVVFTWILWSIWKQRNNQI
jgi:hypothetical protein